MKKLFMCFMVLTTLLTGCTKQEKKIEPQPVQLGKEFDESKVSDHVKEVVNEYKVASDSYCAFVEANIDDVDLFTKDEYFVHEKEMEEAANKVDALKEEKLNDDENAYVYTMAMDSAVKLLEVTSKSAANKATLEPKK